MDFLKILIAVLLRFGITKTTSLSGCASPGSGGTRIGNVDNPLGYCFYLCKNIGHIGLAGAMCHCLTDDAINALPINNATCSYETCGSGLVCGSNRTMWIYGVGKKNFTWTSTTYDSVEEKCVSLTQSSDGAKWNVIKCTTGCRTLCITKDGTVDRKEAAVNRGATWGNALKICHDKLENLANISLENYRSVILNQRITGINTAWTSFVRDMVVGFDEKLLDLVDCAVIYKSDGKIKLDYQNCSNSFLAVCLNDRLTGLQSTSTVTSTTTSTTHMTTTGTTEAPTTTGSTTPSTSISTNLQTASTTKVTNTRTIQQTTSARHAAAAGNISTDTLATSRIEFGIITTTTTATTNTTTTSTAQSATVTSSATVSTVELIVLRAVVGSLAGLLVASVLLNYCQFRKIRRSQMENKNKMKFEEENMEYYNMSVKDKTKVTRGDDESSTTSTQTVLNESRSVDHGYTTLKKLEMNTENEYSNLKLT